MLYCKKYLLCCLVIMNAFAVSAQKEKKPLMIELSYNVKNNQFPYLVVFTKTKEEKKFPPVPNTEVNVYLNEEADGMLLGKVKTDQHGKARVVLGAAFKPAWDSSDKFTFLATTAGDNNYESASTDISITKAKIFIDTVADAETRSLAATVMEKSGQDFLPVKEVEVKVIVSRMAGNLSVNESESFTTDSAGVAVAEFKRDSIPGDKEGYITIIAKTEDNDTYGNLSVEKKIKWGAPFVASNDFDKRSLFATRDKSPVWLLILAYSIAFGVWGTIVYLVSRIIVMRKVGLAVKNI